MNACVLWFRQDLRLHDNPALNAAIATGKPVVPAYIWAPEEEGHWQPGAASRWWLHHALKSLDESLTKLGAPLIIRLGSSLETLMELVKETDADTVIWNDRYEPLALQRDSKLREQLQRVGVKVATFNSTLLFEPDQIVSKSGGPYKVFTAFWNRCSEESVACPLPTPRELEGLPKQPNSIDLTELKLLPTIKWDSGIKLHWAPGEAQSLQRLEDFLDESIHNYNDGRNLPAEDDTSRFSPYLHFGELSVRQAWHAIKDRLQKKRGTPGFDPSSARVFMRELGWREFAYHILINFPHTTDMSMHAAFDRLPLPVDHDILHAWQKGQTGYPIVDAGMRELWHTGWMHNRMRMIAASFLTKHLLQPWQAGAEWFWDTLVDADLANNSMGWQWVAGSGVDAAPFFRIFNPVLQGEKFDPRGEYVRRWVPELNGLPDRVIHTPWKATSEQRQQAGLAAGDYPFPIVDHAMARHRALEAFALIRGNRSP